MNVPGFVSVAATITKNRIVRMMRYTGVIGLGLCIATDAAAFFDYAPIDFPKDFPANYGVGPDNPGFDAFPEGLITSAQGVPFNAGPIGGNSIWCPGGCAGTGTDGFYSMTAPVGLSGIHTVYTLMNTTWGATGEERATVEFKFEGVATPYYAKLEDGNHLRDAGLLWNNTINGVNTVKAFDLPVGVDPHPFVIDMQAFAIPEALWDKKLTGIVFSDHRSLFQHGLLLRGITVSTLDHVTPGAISIIPGIPEPETYALLLAGLSLVGFITRRKSKSHIFE